jgi:WD40 repeat protein
MDGKILVGHDNGRIQTVDINTETITPVNTSHHDGECWGLEIIQENGTFLTCGDDNEIHEYSIKDKQVIRTGKVWSLDLNEGKSFKTDKIKSTASTLCDYPAHQ